MCHKQKLSTNRGPEVGHQLLKQYATSNPRIFDIPLTKQAQELQEECRPIKQISPSVKSKAHTDEVTSNMFVQKSIWESATRSDSRKEYVTSIEANCALCNLIRRGGAESEIRGRNRSSNLSLH